MINKNNKFRETLAHKRQLQDLQIDLSLQANQIQIAVFKLFIFLKFLPFLFWFPNFHI